MSFDLRPAHFGSSTASSAIADRVVEVPAVASNSDDVVRSRPKHRADIIQMVAGCDAELRIVQSRLGTPDERTGDTELARELAHKAKNLRFAIELWAQMMSRVTSPRPAA